MFRKTSCKHIDWKAYNIVVISVNCFNQSTTDSLYAITTSLIPKQTLSTA